MGLAGSNNKFKLVHPVDINGSIKPCFVTKEFVTGFQPPVQGRGKDPLPTDCTHDAAVGNPTRLAPTVDNADVNTSLSQNDNARRTSMANSIDCARSPGRSA